MFCVTINLLYCKKGGFSVDTFDNTVKKAKDLFGVAVKKTGDTISVQKLKVKLVSSQNNLKKMYAFLGKKWFDEIKRSQNLDEETKSAITAIEEENKCIEHLKDEISSVSGKKVCVNCNALLPVNAKFCLQCGAPLDEKNTED